MAKNSATQIRLDYIKVFENETGKKVLSDLRDYCCAVSTTESQDVEGRIDPNKMLILEGRRQVYNQIMRTLKIDYSEYFEYDITDY